MTNGSSFNLGLQTGLSEAVGLDLSDKSATYVVVDALGEVAAEGKVALSQASLSKVFPRTKRTRIAIEVGTHSPWVSRLLAELGHEVIVANARQVKLISQNKRKNDREDAELLARLARFDPNLLKPVRHRGPQAQADLAILRSRDCLVRTRAALINHVRGAVKASGGRIPDCNTNAFAGRARDHLPDFLQVALLPLLETIAQLTEQVKAHDRQLKKAAEERYPEATLLRQVKGVGPVTALAFVLVLEEPARFTKSRSVGAFLGLTTRQAQSGEREPQMHITKTGDEILRRLLVQAAHYILGPFGPDCDLRRWGMKLAGDSNKIRKRKAVIAVARKLAVLLHRLWMNGLIYEPLRAQPAIEEVVA